MNGRARPWSLADRTAAPADVLAVLTRAAASAQIVAVELRGGRHFRDGVCEVFSGCGADFVIFHAHNRFVVDDITHCAVVAHAGP